MDESVVLPGWERHWDETTDCPYYHHPATGTTVWSLDEALREQSKQPTSLRTDEEKAAPEQSRLGVVSVAAQSTSTLVDVHLSTSIYQRSAVPWPSWTAARDVLLWLVLGCVAPLVGLSYYLSVFDMQQCPLSRDTWGTQAGLGCALGVWTGLLLACILCFSLFNTLLRSLSRLWPASVVSCWFVLGVLWFTVLLVAVPRVGLNTEEFEATPLELGDCTYRGGQQGANLTSFCPGSGPFIVVPWERSAARRAQVAASCGGEYGSVFESQLQGQDITYYEDLMEFVKQGVPLLAALHALDPKPCVDVMLQMMCTALFPPCNSECTPVPVCPSLCTQSFSACGGLDTVQEMISEIMPGGRLRVTQEWQDNVPLTAHQHHTLDIILFGIYHCPDSGLGQADLFTCVSKSVLNETVPTVQDTPKHVNAPEFGTPMLRFARGAEAACGNAVGGLDYVSSAASGTAGANGGNSTGSSTYTCTVEAVQRVQQQSQQSDTSRLDNHDAALQASTSLLVLFVVFMLLVPWVDWGVHKRLTAAPQLHQRRTGTEQRQQATMELNELPQRPGQQQSSSQRQTAPDDESVAATKANAISSSSSAMMLSGTVEQQEKDVCAVNPQSSPVACTEGRLTWAAWYNLLGWELIALNSFSGVLAFVSFYIAWQQRDSLLYAIMFYVLAVWELWESVLWLCWTPELIDARLQGGQGPLSASFGWLWASSCARWKCQTYSTAETESWERAHTSSVMGNNDDTENGSSANTQTKRCHDCLSLSSLRYLYLRYKSLFGFHGRYYFVKQLALETAEVITQMVQVSAIARSTDSWLLCVLVFGISVNLILSPLLFLTTDAWIRRIGSLIFDATLDVFYLSFILAVRDIGNVDFALALGLSLPLTSHILRQRMVTEVVMDSRLSLLGLLDARPESSVLTPSAASASSANSLRKSSIASAGQKSRSLGANTGSDRDAPTHNAGGEAVVRSSTHRASVSFVEALHVSVTQDGNTTHEPSGVRRSQCGCWFTWDRVLVWCTVLLGLCLLVSTVVRIVSQHRECTDVVGSVIWERSHPQVVFGRGFMSPAACGFEAVTVLNLSHTSLRSDALTEKFAQVYTVLHTLDVSYTAVTSLPTQMWRLSLLRTLVLSHTTLSFLPVALTQLSRLTTLDLSHSNVAYVSPLLYELPHMVRLDATATPFSVSVPWSAEEMAFFSASPIRISRLPSLFVATMGSSVQTLQCHGNAFTVLPNALNSFSQLRVANFSSNLITTVQSGLRLTVVHLDLSHNLLVEVPPMNTNFWLNSDQLVLDLSHNPLLQSIPTEIARLLQPIGLRDLPKMLELIWTVGITHVNEGVADLTGLRLLNLDNNLLTDLPWSLHSLTALQTLSVASNRLQDVPAVIRTLTQLTRLNIGNNVLATLPSWISELGALQELSVRGNHQLWSLPSELAQLRHLKQLFIFDTPISVVPSLTDLTLLDMTEGYPVPPLDIFGCTNLTILRLDGIRYSVSPEVTHLAGPVPLTDILGDGRLFPHLSEIQAARMDMSVFPVELARHLTSLLFLNVNDNPPLTTLPWYELRGMQTLLASGCGLTSLNITQWSELVHVHVTNNNINSSAVWGDATLRNLVRVTIDSNPLSYFPTLFASYDFPRLTYLDVSNCGMTSLSSLVTQTGNNASLLASRLPQLETLRLNNNQLSAAAVPSILSALPNLRALDLSGNAGLVRANLPSALRNKPNLNLYIT